MSEANNDDKTCGLCNTKTSKYCCPRCDILYCSLDCYKSAQHLQCSENFYKDCITDELASYEPDDDSKQKMIEILKKMQSGDESTDILQELDDVIDSDDEDVDLHDRIMGLDLNDASTVWNVLNDDERNEFKAMLSQGDVTSIIPQWEPWWLYRTEKKLVEDVEQNNIKEERLQRCPSLLTVPDIGSLTKVQPSPSIKYNITNVLASYAFILRYFNGDIDPIEAVIYLLNICANLDSNNNFEETSLAVESVAQKCLQSDLIQTDSVSLDVMRYDSFLLLKGPSDDNKNHYCKAALSDLHRIFTLAKSNSKLPKNKKTKDNFSKDFPDHTVDNLPPLDLSKVKRCVKKIEFYLSYVQSCTIDFELN